MRGNKKIDFIFSYLGGKPVEDEKHVFGRRRERGLSRWTRW